MSQRNSRVISTAKVDTANGALVYAGSGSALVDFHARATELRYAEVSKVSAAAAQAYEEDALMAVKLFFQTGDIRGGKGERDTFNRSMDWLIANHPLVALEVLPLIPEYTRWDYLVRLTVSENREIADSATALVTAQFHKDLEVLRNSQDAQNDKKSAPVQISLLAKWMPSLQVKKADQKVVVRHLLKALHMQEREYRHALAQLRNHLHIIEKSMSAKEYDAIDMESMTSKQQLRYADFLQRVLAQKRHEYVQAVLRGEKKMNTSVLNPVDICHEYKKGRYNDSAAYNEDLEALWTLLPNRVTDTASSVNANAAGNTLVVRDGSGSMTMPLGAGSSATMLEAASAMALYCAERLPGVFRDKFITFSNTPRLVDLSDCQTLAQRLNRLYQYDECSNTDIQATFNLILDIAVSQKLTQEELPSYLLILSDMEFDAARASWCSPLVSRQTLFATIRRDWETAGYQMPTLVFWNLNGKRTLFPEIDSKSGVIYLSGFSTRELGLVMSGEYERIEELKTGEAKQINRTMKKRVVLSPQEQLTLFLSKPRYDVVEKAVLAGLAKEDAAS